VVVHFIDIGGIIDHYCLNFLSIIVVKELTSFVYQVTQLCNFRVENKKNSHLKSKDCAIKFPTAIIFLWASRRNGEFESTSHTSTNK
jgi:hypothetical protein